MTQGVNALLPLLIQYLIVRRLDLADIGSLNILLSMQALFGLIVAAANLHLLSVTSNQASCDDSVVISNGTFFGLLCAIPSVVLFMLVALSSDALTNRIGDAIVIIVLSISILLAPFANAYYFQARLLNRQMFTRRVISRFVLLAAVLLFVKSPDDAGLYAVIFSFTLALEYLLAYVKIHSFLEFDEISFKRQKEILLGSIKYLHFNLTYGVLPHYAILFGFNREEEQSFAEFSILVKLVNLITGFITSSVMVLYPFKYTRSQDSNLQIFDSKALFWTAIIALLTALSLLFFSKPIYALMLNSTNPEMDKEFWVLVLYIPIHAIFNYYIFNYFIYESKNLFVMILNSFTLAGFALLVSCNQVFRIGFTVTKMMIAISLGALLVALIYKHLNYGARINI